MLPENNHCALTPRIGVCPAGGFDVVWQSDAAVRPDPYMTSLGLDASGWNEMRPTPSAARSPRGGALRTGEAGSVRPRR